MDEKIKEILKNNKPIPEALKNKIIKHGFLTGSQRFGKPTSESDIDMAIKATDLNVNEIERYFAYSSDLYEGEGKEYFRSFYVKDSQNNIYNLLIFSSKKEYNIWKKASVMMVKLRSVPFFKKMINNKKQRIQIFEIIKGYLR